MKKVTLSLIAFFVFVLVSCAHASHEAGRPLAGSGTATLKGTEANSPISGKVTFRETAEGLKVHAEFQNAPPGKHGFHIHENGDCGDGGKAAGGHYNPEGAPHGFLSKDGLGHVHAGDLGNIDIAADGTGMLDEVIPGLTLKGAKYNILGRSVILHEKEDDFGQPTGNAGGRIGCGVIVE